MAYFGIGVIALAIVLVLGRAFVSADVRMLVRTIRYVVGGLLMASGLGMALVKAIIELHGGWVALESEPGAGATFACHIPDSAPGEGGGPLG